MQVAVDDGTQLCGRKSLRGCEDSLGLRGPLKAEATQLAKIPPCQRHPSRHVGSRVHFRPAARFIRLQIDTAGT